MGLVGESNSRVSGGVCTGDVGDVAECKASLWCIAWASAWCGVVCCVNVKTSLGDIANVGQSMSLFRPLEALQHRCCSVGVHICEALFRADYRRITISFDTFVVGGSVADQVHSRVKYGIE